MVKAPFYLALGLMGLIGCTPAHYEDQNVLEVSEEVTVDRDEFKGAMVYEGPIIENQEVNVNGKPEIEEIRLVARSKNNRSLRFFISVIDYYEGDWRGFDQGYDRDGHKFHALSVRHAVECTMLCGYEEILEVEVSKEYLDLYSPHGITMKLYGPGSASSAPFNIPPHYIQGFLKGAYEEREVQNGERLHIDLSPHATP